MTGMHDRYVDYLQTLTPQRLSALGDFVTDDVRFKDPFNDVRGRDAMAAVFHHMFENVAGIRFAVTRAVTEGDTCLMAWRFEGTLTGGPWVFDGTSVVTFAPDGRVASHFDHWDAAQAFYERLPVIGWLLRRIRGRLAIR